MKKFTALAVALAMVSTASAATFTASIMLPDGNETPSNTPLAIHVHGVLDTAADNDGLVFVSVDLVATPQGGAPAVNLGTAVMWGAPADLSMDNFVRPLGYDANYGGTPVGDNILQAGGAQNTIGNDPLAPPGLGFPSAEFITFGVGHTNQLILEGTITFPAEGSYTLSLENVLANVLADGQTPSSFAIYAVEAATGAADAAVNVDVVDCAVPAFAAGAAGTPVASRVFDGFIDARKESTDGVNADLGMDTLTVVFTTAINNADGTPLSASAFSVSDTGGAAPGIAGITTADGRTVTINLTDHISLQQWTTLSVSGSAQCDAGLLINDSIQIGYLPCDVDQTGSVTPFDLLTFRQYVNGVSEPAVGVVTDYIDTNRNGTSDPFDLLVFRQLINGVTPPATQPWNGQSLP